MTWLIRTLSAATLVVAALGAMEIPRRPFTGLSFDRDGRVTHVEADSPASGAGIVAGDVILREGDSATTDLGALLRNSRPAIGDTRAYVIDRHGRTVEASLVVSGLPAEAAARALMFTGAGLCFLGCGLWAYKVNRNVRTTLLALLCISAALDFVSHPYIPSYPIRVVYLSLLNVIVLWGYACLLHLILALRGSRAASARLRLLLLAVYGPAAVTGILMIVVLLVRPATTGLLVTWFRAAAGASVACYLGLAILVALIDWARATPAERRNSGASTLMKGALIGLVPAAAAGITGAILPSISLPAADWYALTSVALPASLALVTTRDVRSVRRAAPVQGALG